jgi:hypothetical protein
MVTVDDFIRSAADCPDASGADLTGARVLFIGTLHSAVRAVFTAAVRSAGGEIVDEAATSLATMVVVAHGAARQLVGVDGGVSLPGNVSPDALLIGEAALLRRLRGELRGLDEHRPFTAAALRHITGSKPKVISCLALFDVLRPENGAFSYRDLVVLRQVGDLLGGGKVHRDHSTPQPFPRASSQVSPHSLGPIPMGIHTRALT